MRSLVTRICLPTVLAAVVVCGAGAPGPDAEARVGAGGHTMGLFSPGSATWYLLDTYGRTTSFSFGRAGDVPLVGDWDGDGIDTAGLYRPDEGRLIVRNRPEPISYIHPMPAGGMPVVADTNGDGRDTVSLARSGRLYVIDGLGTDPYPLTGLDPLPLVLPPHTEYLVGGDFDGDGVDEIAAVHDGRVQIVFGGRGAVLFEVGRALAVAGDWEGDGVETVGTYDPWAAQFVLYLRASPWRSYVGYGSTGMLPLAGNFGPLPGGDVPPSRRAGIPPLGFDDEGEGVLALQRELARHGLYRGPLDGQYGPATAYAVVTFHKVLGLPRSYEWQEEDSGHMAAFTLPPLPDRPDEPDRVEVDIGRQVLYVFEDHRVTEVVPVSTGGTYRYYSERQNAWVWAGTPRGDFVFLRHAVGWNCDRLTGWCIYNPWNFTPDYALHGYRSVPEYPASHGCVRIPTWESDFLDHRFYVGMPIHVWDEYSPPES